MIDQWEWHLHEIITIGLSSGDFSHTNTATNIKTPLLQHLLHQQWPKIYIYKKKNLSCPLLLSLFFPPLSFSQTLFYRGWDTPCYREVRLGTGPLSQEKWAIFHRPCSIRKSTVVKTIITLPHIAIPHLYIWHTDMVWLHNYYNHFQCVWLIGVLLCKNRGDSSKQKHNGFMHTCIHTVHIQHYADSDLA